jgi:hypothetical protein
MTSYYNKKNPNKIAYILAFAILALVVAGFAYYSYQSRDSASDQTENTINLDPPSEEEQRSADEVKDELTDDTERPAVPRDEDDRIIANVVVVDASQYGNEVEVRAFVSNHIQDGTCTISFSKPGQQTIQKEVQARADASTSICGNVPWIVRISLVAASGLSW